MKICWLVFRRDPLPFSWLLACVAFLLYPALFGCHAAQGQAVEQAAGVIAASPLADVVRDTEADKKQYPVLPAESTRIGNTSGGTTEEAPTWGRTRTHPDGAPYRLAVPFNADRVGLETLPNGEIVVRVHTYWGEGTWQDVYFRQTGEIIAGLNDVPFPRLDIENKTPANEWQYATGLWLDVDPENIPKIGATTNEYRAGVPFRNLLPGKNSGTPGFTWNSTPSGLVVTTPKATVYGLIGFDGAVLDPANGNLAFSQYNSFVLNWTPRGNGKEVSSFAPSYDFTKYPTDPRRTPAPLTHPGPIGSFRAGGELYLVSGENELLIHRWDAKKRLLIPVAAAYVRPDQLPDAIPGKPVITWSEGAIARANAAGQFTAASWQVFNAAVPSALWNGYVYDVDPGGFVLFTPRWYEAKDAQDFIRWQVLDSVNGTLSPVNLQTLAIPDALRSAEKCEQARIDFATGDLIACVNRGAGWVLERYPGWYKAGDKRAAAAAAGYRSKPVVLGTRRQYPWWSSYNKELGASPDPIAGSPSAGFGSMRTLGGYVFIAEAQAGGVRVFRMSDGAIAGRMSDRLHQNSSFDNPTQLQVTQTATEFRVFLLDFHGNSVQVWRVSKKALSDGIAKAKNQ